MGNDDIDHHGEVLIEHTDDLFRRQPFRHRGKTPNIGEENAGAPALLGQDDILGPSTFSATWEETNR